jgi:hypothetical protein
MPLPTQRERHATEHTMKNRPVSPRKPSKIPALWQCGLLLMVFGPLANILAGMVLTAPAGSAAARGQAFGRGLAAALAVITGFVLIILHFVRGRGGRKQDREADDDNLEDTTS